MTMCSPGWPRAICLWGLQNKKQHSRSRRCCNCSYNSQESSFGFSYLAINVWEQFAFFLPLQFHLLILFFQSTVKRCSFRTDLHHRHHYGWKNNKIYMKLKIWFENSLPDMYFKLNLLDLCKICPGHFNVYWKGQYYFLFVLGFLKISKKCVQH